MSTYKNARDIQPGDVIVFLGRPHRITEIEPYDHPSFPTAFGIARAADGWSITLGNSPFPYLKVA